MNISPSEVWNLDLVEINYLSDVNQNDTDLTIMLNFERKMNGATNEWLKGGDLSQLKN